MTKKRIRNKVWTRYENAYRWADLENHVLSKDFATLRAKKRLFKDKNASNQMFFDNFCKVGQKRIHLLRGLITIPSYPYMKKNYKNIKL